MNIKRIKKPFNRHLHFSGMGSTHCIFGNKIIRVRFTPDGRYLLKKDIKWKDIEKLVHIEGHRIFAIHSNRTYNFTIKSFDAT